MLAERMRSDRRGGSLRDLLMRVLDDVASKLDDYDGEAGGLNAVSDPHREELALAVERKYERVLTQLRVIQMTISKYQDCVDREDIPIGLQYLIDTTMRELTGGDGDPIIDLEPLEGYSTVDLISEITVGRPEQVESDGPAPRRPIALNLPAEDPSNALLAPLIVHEVAHTAVEMRLAEALRLAAAEESQAVSAVLQGLSTSMGEVAADGWRKNFRDWVTELLCDAVAVARTGPSFMFAFAAYSRPTAAGVVTTHPSPRIRIAFQLRMLVQLGWRPLLEDIIPATMSWFDSLASNMRPGPDPQEQFLVKAIGDIESHIAEAALNDTPTPFTPADFGSAGSNAKSNLQQGIPAVDELGTALSPWQIVLAGWVGKLEETPDPTADAFGDDVGSVLIEAVGDDGFNALLVKSIELASIVDMWRRYERTYP
jgi:hypothetical protein